MEPRKILAFTSAFFVFFAGAGLHFIPTSLSTQWFTLKNESAWAHQYLFAWPYLLTNIVYWSLHRKIDPNKDAFMSRFYGFIAATLILPAIFSIYTRGNADNSILAVDILIFVIMIVSAELVSYYTRSNYSNLKLGFGVTLNLLLLGIIILLVYVGPESNFLFDDPEQPNLPTPI